MKRLLVATLSLWASSALAVEGDDLESLVAQCAPGVHPVTMTAIVRHESRANPFAIGINTDGVRLPRQPQSQAEAIAVATRLKEEGHNFDAGLGQINIENLGWLGLSVADLFDPCKNLGGSARVITDCYQRASSRYSDEQEALHAALSCYNTGNFRAGLANGYVMKVASAATLDVPALTTIPSGQADPLRLHGSNRSAASRGDRKPLPGEIGDAFSNPGLDAFNTKGTPQGASENEIKE